MGKYITQLAETLGNQLGGGIVGAGMGLLLEGHNDRRQIRQQQKLQDMQISGNKQMIDYQKMKDLEMWKETSYPTQMEMMKKAGLNPALLYGMGGSGGSTTGGGGGSVTSAQAPSGGREVIEGTGMGIQMQMLQAQKQLIEAQTNKTNIEANKTAGVDTTKVETEIQNLTQGLNNLKAEEQMKKAQIRMINLESELAGRTIEDRIEMVNYETKRACQEAQQAVNNTNVSDKTILDKINIIKREAIQLLLQNSNIRQQTATGKAQEQNLQQSTLTNQTLRRKIASDIQQGYDNINIQKDKNWIIQKLGEAGIDVQEQGQILGAITGIMSMGMHSMPKESSTHWESYNEETGYGQHGSTHSKHR